MTEPEYDTEGLPPDGQPSDEELDQAVQEQTVTDDPANDQAVPDVEPYDPATDAVPPESGWDAEVPER